MWSNPLMPPLSEISHWTWIWYKKGCYQLTLIEDFDRYTYPGSSMTLRAQPCTEGRLYTAATLRHLHQSLPNFQITQAIMYTSRDREAINMAKRWRKVIWSLILSPTLPTQPRRRKVIMTLTHVTDNSLSVRCVSVNTFWTIVSPSLV